MKKAVCFGDSNTWGYDPRDVLGGRYPPEARWPERLAELSGWEVRGAGINGRTIPMGAARPLAVKEIGQAELVFIMLGTNDRRFLSYGTPERVGERMDGFLRFLREALPETELWLIAPPGDLGPVYRPLAEKYGAGFSDAEGWDLPLAYDGLHLSEEGQRRFADCLYTDLRTAGLV